MRNVLWLFSADINDNTPFFVPSSYSYHVSYFASVGASVLTVTAIDYDVGVFGTLTYTLDQVNPQRIHRIAYQIKQKFKE